MNPVLDLYCSNVLQVAALQNEGVRLANIINKSTEQYKFSQPLQQCNIFRSVFAEYSPPVCFLAKNVWILLIFRHMSDMTHNWLNMTQHNWVK